MIDIRANLQRLIADLERDIRENPDRRQAELAALQNALAVIDGRTPASIAATQPDSPFLSPRPGSKKEYFRSVVNQMIDLEPKKRVHRSAIIQQVRMLGMFGGSSDVDRDVSKYLSLDGTFKPDGDGYWKRKGAIDIDAGPNGNRPEGSNPSDLLAGDTR